MSCAVVSFTVILQYQNWVQSTFPTKIPYVTCKTKWYWENFTFGMRQRVTWSSHSFSTLSQDQVHICSFSHQPMPMPVSMVELGSDASGCGKCSRARLEVGYPDDLKCVQLSRLANETHMHMWTHTHTP